MTPRLRDHQKLAVEQLKTGSILQGGVGSGKTITAIFYYFTRECKGKIDEIEGISEMQNPKDLYVITTAKKRDTLDWERECANFLLSKDRTASINGIKLTVDSWNNIKKYVDVEGAFFIFDEQRVVRYGAWSRSFLKIAKHNNWILLSATPGDTWMDYAPVFIANGFYRNITDFRRTHVVLKPYIHIPIIDHYVEEGRLQRLKREITVNMTYAKSTISKSENVLVSYDKEKVDLLIRKRWNPYKNAPLRDANEYCLVMRKIVNSDPSRFEAIQDLMNRHSKVIIFYNFNFELDILMHLADDPQNILGEHNGRKHDPIPEGNRWAYLVQYNSGSEGWNCIETNTVIFYSQSYSYRMMHQAAGRIDRLNTPFSTLYYYYLRSKSPIDLAIAKALTNKQNFNESKFVKFS